MASSSPLSPLAPDQIPPARVVSDGLLKWANCYASKKCCFSSCSLSLSRFVWLLSPPLLPGSRRAWEAAAARALEIDGASGPAMAKKGAQGKRTGGGGGLSLFSHGLSNKRARCSALRTISTYCTNSTAKNYNIFKALKNQEFQ